MIKDTIDGALLRDMFLTGAALLEKNRALVDSLNVFPVPDGDTGTNMSMTMQGAVKDLRTMPETATVEEVMAKVSAAWSDRESAEPSAEPSGYCAYPRPRRRFG